MCDKGVVFCGFGPIDNTYSSFGVCSSSRLNWMAYSANQLIPQAARVCDYLVEIA